MSAIYLVVWFSLHSQFIDLDGEKHLACWLEPHPKVFMNERIAKDFFTSQYYETVKISEECADRVRPESLKPKFYIAEEQK